MKKLLLLVVATVATISVYGQDAIANGDRLFDEGKYEDAKRQYMLHKENGVDRLDYADARIEQCDECAQLLVLADHFFSGDNRLEAWENYRKIQTINPNDPYVNERLKSIPVYGVEINGTMWATRNVGVEGFFIANPENHGNFYTYDEAQSACPKGWRMPLPNEYQDLMKANPRWETLNGIPGIKIDSNNNTVFIPAAGMINQEQKMIEQNSNVYFWDWGDGNEDNLYGLSQSDIETDTSVYITLTHYPTIVDHTKFDVIPIYRLPVRCVKE